MDFAFQTENDTEVAAGYMSWRMREGDSLEQTLNASLNALDGFYTFVVGTETASGCCAIRSLASRRSWRKRTLGRVRHRVSRAGRSARHRYRPGLGADAGQSVSVGAALICAPSTSRGPRCASSTRRCTVSARSPTRRIGGCSIRAGSTRSPPASTRRSKSRSTGMSATTARA